MSVTIVYTNVIATTSSSSLPSTTAINHFVLAISTLTIYPTYSSTVITQTITSTAASLTSALSLLSKISSNAISSSTPRTSAVFQTSAHDLSKDEIAGISVALAIVLCFIMITIYALCTTTKRKQHDQPEDEVRYIESRSPSVSTYCGVSKSRTLFASITNLGSKSFRGSVRSDKLTSMPPLSEQYMMSSATGRDSAAANHLSATDQDTAITTTFTKSTTSPTSGSEPVCTKTSKFLFFPHHLQKPIKSKRSKLAKRQSTISLSRFPSLTLLSRRSTQARREEALLKARLNDGYTREVYRMREIDMDLQNETEGPMGSQEVGEVVMGGLTEEGRGFAELTMEYQRETKERLRRIGEEYRAGVRGRKEVNW